MGRAETELPNDVETEKAFLGTALVHEDHLPTYVTLVQRDDFYREAHRHIWDAILRLHSEGGAVDVVTVAGALKDAGHLEEIGGNPTLVEIVASSGAASHALDYGSRIAVLAQRRRVIASATKLDKALRGDDTEEIERLLAEIERASQSGLSRPASALPLLDLDALLKENIQTPWLIRDRIAQGDLIFWSGTGGVGKSWLAYDLCVCLAIGREWLGVKPETRGPTLYIDAENPKHGLRNKLIRLYGPKKPPAGVHISHQPGVTFDTSEGIGRLRRTIEQIVPCLVIIDPLYMFHDGNENSNGDMANIVRPLRKITHDFNVSIIVLHHEAKDPDGIRTGSTKMRGAAILQNICDQHFSITRTTSGNKFVHEKARHQDLVKTIVYKKEDLDDYRTRLVVVDAPAENNRDIACIEVMSWLNAKEDAPSAADFYAEFVDGRQWPRATFYRVRAELFRRGWIAKSGMKKGEEYLVSQKLDIVPAKEPEEGGTAYGSRKDDDEEKKPERTNDQGPRSDQEPTRGSGERDGAKRGTLAGSGAQG